MRLRAAVYFVLAFAAMALAIILVRPASAQIHQKGSVFQANDCMSWASDGYAYDLTKLPCLSLAGTQNGQTLYNNNGQLGSYLPSGDVTVNPSTGIETVITATSSVLGKVRPDNTTCTVSAGVLTCNGIGGGYSPDGVTTYLVGTTFYALAGPRIATPVTVSTSTATITIGKFSDIPITMTANSTLTISAGFADGQITKLVITQDGTGSRTVAFDSSVIFGSTLPSWTASTGANLTDFVGLRWSAAASAWTFLANANGFTL